MTLVFRDVVGAVPYGMKKTCRKANITAIAISLRNAKYNRPASSFGADFPDETGKMSRSDKRGALCGESGKIERKRDFDDRGQFKRSFILSPIGLTSISFRQPTSPEGGSETVRIMSSPE